MKSCFNRTSLLLITLNCWLVKADGQVCVPDHFMKHYQCNRYGREVFTTKEATRGWNGKLRDQEQSAGVYVYILQILTLDGRKMLKKGNFTLVR